MTTTVKNKTNNSKVEIVKLASINNGQLVLDKITRKPIDQIGKKANKLTTSILATGSKSNALISKAMFDLIGYDMQLMSLDFNVYNDTKTNKNSTANKKANVRSIPTKLQNELRQQAYDKDTLEFLQANGSNMRAVYNFITMNKNDMKSLNEMCAKNGLYFNPDNKAFYRLDNDICVSYKTVYNFLGIQVDHKNQTATVKKTNGHIKNNPVNKKPTTKASNKKDVKIELSLNAIQKMDVETLRKTATEIWNIFGASFDVKKLDASVELTKINTAIVSVYNDKKLLSVSEGHKEKMQRLLAVQHVAENKK